MYSNPGGDSPIQSNNARLSSEGQVKPLHGMNTRVIDDEVEVHSVSAGLDYPGVGPEHAVLDSLGWADYFGITDDEALTAFRELSELEGIIPALESSHAVALVKRLVERDGLSEEDTVVVNLSGRGDKDMETVVEEFGL